jgi:hypothetical protein
MFNLQRRKLLEDGFNFLTRGQRGKYGAQRDACALEHGLATANSFVADDAASVRFINRMLHEPDLGLILPLLYSVPDRHP